MIRFQTHISCWQQTSFVCLLMVTLFAQNLLPLQAHTHVAITKTGKTVLLCTLQGVQSFELDADGRIGNLIVSNHESAAFRFSQLLAYSVTALSEFDLSPFKSVPFHFIEIVQSIPENKVVSYFSIRAPPLLFV